MLNALAQVKPSYRDALKKLNAKLETMDGAIPDDDADEIIKIMNGRLTSREYSKASLPVQREDDNKGDFELDEEDYQKLNEDM